MSNRRKKIDAALDGLFSSKRRTGEAGIPPGVDVSEPSPGSDEVAAAPDPADAVVLLETDLLPPSIDVDKETTGEPVTSPGILDEPRQDPAGSLRGNEVLPVPQPPEPVLSAVPAGTPLTQAVRNPEKSSEMPAIKKPEVAGQEVSSTAAPRPVPIGGTVERPVAHPEAEQLPSDELQIVVFRLGSQYYGVEIKRVEAIIKMQSITRVPHSHAYVRGLTNLRGSVLPVIDLRRRFALPDGEATKDTRIVVLMVEAEKVGMIVDGVSEVVTLAAGSIEAAPAMVTTIDTTYLTGIGKMEDKLVMLVNMGRVLNVASGD